MLIVFNNWPIIRVWHISNLFGRRRYEIDTNELDTSGGITLATLLSFLITLSPDSRWREMERKKMVLIEFHFRFSSAHKWIQMLCIVCDSIFVIAFGNTHTHTLIELTSLWHASNQIHLNSVALDMFVGVWVFFHTSSPTTISTRTKTQLTNNWLIPRRVLFSFKSISLSLKLVEIKRKLPNWQLFLVYWTKLNDVWQGHFNTTTKIFAVANKN